MHNFGMDVNPNRFIIRPGSIHCCASVETVAGGALGQYGRVWVRNEPFHVDVGPENRVMITLDFEVLEGVQSGASGMIKVSASSELNAIESTHVDLLVDVITIHDLQFTIEDETSKTVTYPEKAIFTMFVTCPKVVAKIQPPK